MQRLIQQILRFGVVGVCATAIDFLVLVILVEFVGLHPTPAAAISFTVSLVVNYLASMHWVFSPRDDLSPTKQFVIFLLLSLVGLGLNELIMWLGEKTVLAAGLNYSVGPYYLAVKVVATGLVMVWNFMSRRHWLDASMQRT